MGKGTKVTLVRKDGSKFEVTPEQAERLKLLNYAREETAEDMIDEAERVGEARYYDRASQKALTVAEGWVSGALPGVGDAINPDKEGARARAAHNPGLRLGAELTAGLTGALITGGSSSIGRGVAGGGAGVATALGNKTAATLGGGAAARIAGVGVEGALLGGGSALSDAVLSGDPLTASSVLAHVGPSTLLSMGLGAAGEGLISLGKLGRKGAAVEEVLETGTRQGDNLSSFYKALPDEKPRPRDGTPSWLKDEVADADVGVVDRYTKEVDVARQVNPFRDEDFSAFRSAISDYTTTADDVLKNVDNTLKSARTAAKEYTRQVESSAAELNAAVKSIKRDAANLAENRAMRRSIENDFVSLEEGYKELRLALRDDDPVKALNRVERFKQAIKDNPYFAGPAGAALPGLPDPKIAVRTRDALRAADETLRTREARDILRTFPTSQKEFLHMRPDKAEKLFAALDHAKVDDSVMNKLAEQAGFTLSGTPGQKARALWEAGKDIRRFETEAKRVSRAEMRLPQDIPTPSVANADSFERLVAREPKKAQWPEIVDTPEAAVRQAAGTRRGGGNRGGGNTATLWHKIARLTASREAAAAARRAGLGIAGSAAAYEIGGSTAAGLFGGSFIAGIAGIKGGITSRIMNAVAKYAPTAGRGIKRIAPKIEPLAVRLDGILEDRENMSKRELFKKRSEELLSAGPSIRDTVFMAVEPLIGEHPEFANAIHQTFIDAFNALMTFLPRDPNMAFNRMQSLWNPTDVQISQFSKALAVFHDPMGTIEAILETGAADATTVAAVKTIYPPLYQELQSAMLYRLSDQQFLNSLSYGDQARLSILLDIPLHSSFTPRSIAQTQALYRKQRPTQPSMDGASSGGGRPAKTEPPTAGQSLIQSA